MGDGFDGATGHEGRQAIVTSQDLAAAVGAVTDWIAQMHASIDQYKGRKLERDPDWTVEQFLAAVPVHVHGNEIAAMEDTAARLPEMARRFEHLETVFDAHFAGVPAEDPQAFPYAQSVRESLVAFRQALVTLTGTVALGVEQAVQEGEATRDPSFGRVTSVAVHAKDAIRDAAGIATLRLRRMIRHLDEKYGTSGGD